MSASVRLPDDWETSVRDAITQRRPDLADGALRLLGAGLESVALLLEHGEERFVLRLPQGEDGAESIEREARLLPELAPRVDLPIPVFTFTAPNPLGPGSFCVYPLVPGDSLSDEEWRDRGLLTAPAPARQVAAFVDAVHAFPVERAAELGVEEWDLRQDFTEGLDLIRTDVVPLLRPEEAAQLIGAWESYIADDGNFAYRRTLTHADVSLDHLLVTGSEISGVIDFGDVEIGDPDYDLAYLWADAGPDFVRRVQEHRGSPLTERQEAKLRFWSLADPANDILHGIENDMTDFRADSLHTLRTRLARR